MSGHKNKIAKQLLFEHVFWVFSRFIFVVVVGLSALLAPFLSDAILNHEREIDNMRQRRNIKNSINDIYNSAKMADININKVFDLTNIRERIDMDKLRAHIDLAEKYVDIYYNKLRDKYVIYPDDYENLFSELFTCFGNSLNNISLRYYNLLRNGNSKTPTFEADKECIDSIMNNIENRLKIPIKIK